MKKRNNPFEIKKWLIQACERAYKNMLETYAMHDQFMEFQEKFRDGPSWDYYKTRKDQAYYRRYLNQLVKEGIMESGHLGTGPGGVEYYGTNYFVSWNLVYNYKEKAKHYFGGKTN